MKNNKKAFTLVELIVVITILAILGTIAFISIQSYTVYARDAVRTSDLGSISRAITIKIAQGGYAPKPNNPVTITSSGTTVMFQGEFTQKMGAQYGVNGDLVDPLDGKNYTYSTDANLFKHELAGFLESDELTFDSQTHQTLAFTQKVQALEGRTVFTKGDKLGIIFNSEETPIQELSLSGSTLDIVNTTDTYKVYFDNNETIEGTGSTLSVVNPFYSCRRYLELGYSKDKKYTIIGNDGVSEIKDCNMTSIILGEGTSCKDILEKDINNQNKDGIYSINPTGGSSLDVYCDMTTDGGGWTLISRIIADGTRNHGNEEKFGILYSPSQNMLGKLSDAVINEISDEGVIRFTCRDKTGYYKTNDGLWNSNHSTSLHNDLLGSDSYLGTYIGVGHTIGSKYGLSNYIYNGGMNYFGWHQDYIPTHLWEGLPNIGCYETSNYWGGDGTVFIK